MNDKLRKLYPAVATALDEADRCTALGDSEGAGNAIGRAKRAMVGYAVETVVGLTAVALVGWVLVRWLRA